MKTAGWKTVVQSPLNSMLDTRSRPPDLSDARFRYKLNMAINSSGKLCRRAGWARFALGSESANWDHHRRGGSRTLITRLYENVSPDGVRQLLDATETTVSILDNDTGEWTDILSGMGGGNWSMASLRDKIVLTNNIDPIKIYTLGDAAAITLASLEGDPEDPVTLPVRKAKVAIEYAGVVVLMNLEVDKDGGGTERFSSRVQWCNYNDATDWANTEDDDVANYQDLDYGEEILNAVPFSGGVYIFTDKSIWKMFIQAEAGTEPQIFGFQKWYSEPKNRTACLAYDNAIVSTGTEIFYLGRQTIFFLNKFSSAPESPDWIRRGSGLVFEGAQRIDSLYCQSPVADFVPNAEGAAKEVWFSYPTIEATEDTLGINSRTIVLSFDKDTAQSAYNTADYIDHGFSAFGSFSANSDTGDRCKGDPMFLAASATDYCIKIIGGAFQRDMVILVDGDPEEDIPDLSATTISMGYISVVRGLCPLGIERKKKRLRNLILDHDTITSDGAYIHLRIGNTAMIQDPNETEGNCRVLWHDIDSFPLVCPSEMSPSQLTAAGMREDGETEFPMLEEGNHLYYEITIADEDKAAVIGGDSAWASLSWDYLK